MGAELPLGGDPLDDRSGNPVTLAFASQTIGAAFALALDIGDFNAFVELLEAQGDTRVLSSPRVATLNNQKAVIKAGTDEFFVTDVSSNTVTGTAATTSRDVTLTPFFSGIALDVTPQISADGEVILHIHPTVSEVTDQTKELTVSGETDALPLAFSEIRESDSVVKAKSGQIIAIGGLMRNSSRAPRARDASARPRTGPQALVRQHSRGRDEDRARDPAAADRRRRRRRLAATSSSPRRTGCRRYEQADAETEPWPRETRKRVRLGDLLLEKKLISEQQLKEALAEQRRSGRKLGRVLVDIGAVSEADLHSCLATCAEHPVRRSRAHERSTRRSSTSCRRTHARRHRALVLKEDARGYLVGMADPTDLFAFDELARVLAQADPLGAREGGRAAEHDRPRLPPHGRDRLAGRGARRGARSRPTSTSARCRPRRARPTRRSSS